MGFYGNMTNSVKTNMTFDRKYSSRKAMDEAVSGDGVYAGRYVLVEYGLDWTSSVVSDVYNNTDVNKISKFYKYANDNSAIYTDTSCRVKYIKAEDGQVFYIAGKRSGSKTEDCHELWIYKDSKYNLITEKMLDKTADANYVTNFNIDKEIYGAGRGYDSTVWTKTYGTDGVPRYVMIAELNAIIPTFTLTVDAPSDKPNAPYFDELGSNVHYDMHIRNPWGYKVGDIKFNETGFLETKKQFNDADIPLENRYDYSLDAISIDNVPWDPNESDIIDTKKLSINLPSIGNMVAKGWDIIHGEDRQDNPATSLQGRLNFFTKELNENEIPVQSQGGYLVGATFKEEDKDNNDNRLWIESIVDSAGKKITVKHTFKQGEDTNTFANKNTNSELEEGQTAGINHATDDVLKLYTPLVDKMGHVIAKNIETVTLPYGYKTIIPGSNSNSIENITSNTNSIIANSTKDSLTIAPGNKWIHLAGDDSKNTLTIAHEIHDQQKDEDSIIDWTRTERNTIIPVTIYTHDKAGHHTNYHINQYKLPFGYGKIKGDDNTSTAATATYDELTFTSDEWLTAKVETDTIKYEHNYPNQKNDVIKDSLDLNNPSLDTITLETVSTDTTGHVTNKNLQTVTLPYGYKTFIGDNGTTSASNTQDVMNINGDSWIDATISEDKITLTHKNPTGTVPTAIDNKTPKFGETFTLDDHYFDSKGHRFNSNTHTVKIPSLSLTSSGAGNVVTGISLTAEDGAFIETKVNAGTLLLTDYALGNDSNKISDTDSINGAFSKLQKQIDNTVNSIKTAIEALDSSKTASEGKYISGIHIVDGKISAIDETALPEISWNDVTNKPNNLVTSDQIVNMVEDTDIEGMVTESSKFTYPAIIDSTGAEISPADAAMTIVLLFEKVAALEARIYALEHPITETPDPTPEEGGEETLTE